MSTTSTRKMYPALDIAKFVMAMLILTQHTCNEWAHSTGIVHAFFGLGNFAVPFFFACSGFLFFTKLHTLDNSEQKKYYRTWSIRIGKMYLVWSLIYFCFIFIGWINTGFEFSKILRWTHRSIVFSTYATIWFLPALWLGVSICYWMKRHCSSIAMTLTAVVLLVIGNSFGSYTYLLAHNSALATLNDYYIDIFVTWRNGIFNGAPFVFIGLLIARGIGSKIPQWLNIIASLAFGIAFLLEAFCISRYKLSSVTDMGFMMAPAIFFLMNTLINWNLKQRNLWQHCRNLSMLVFLSQRLFLTALPGVLPWMKQWISSLSQPCIFIYFIVVVLTFSIIIERMSQKFKFLKILW